MQSVTNCRFLIWGVALREQQAETVMETLRTVGKEVVPVGLEFKSLYKAEMTQSNASTGEEYYTEKGNTTWTVVLALIPVITFTIAGVVVLVRRRAKT